MSESEIHQLVTADPNCSTNEESSLQPGELDTSYCFKWTNYQNHLSEVVRQLLDEESMVDVTLWAGGERIQAHRLVLCACSTLFQEILSQVNDEHATIILSDITGEDLKYIIEFCYNGEVRIPVENFNNLLGAAYSLKIYGLMEIGELTEIELCGDKGQEDSKFNFSDLSELDEVHMTENVNDEEDNRKRKISESNVISLSSGILKQKKSCFRKDYNEEDLAATIAQTNATTVNSELSKRRKSVSKKDYSDDDLAAAIADIKSGSSLLEAASKNHIPRSTLYMRAKILNVPLNPSRSDYTNEDMKAAIQDVLGGSSLQQAAVCHGIPKTVLWRRIQKEGHERIKRDVRRSYGAEKREAAIKALARGECLTKVANEYKIPKTTLFRDKARLVDEGKLPSSFYKKRKSESEELKQSRLLEAVAACKTGKMSQAIASVTYQIPKTTIWRHLQKENNKNNDSEKSKNEQKKSENFVKLELSQKNEPEDLQNLEVYCENADMDIAYIDDSSISADDPVIILTSGSVDDLNLPNNQLVVVHEDENFVSCGLELDENSTFELKS